MLNNISYSLIKSKRKTISLKISKEGELIVRAPLYITKKEVEKIILDKRSWIEKNKRIVKDKREDVKHKKYDTWEKFLFLGIEYTIAFTGDGDDVIFRNNKIFFPCKYAKNEIYLYDFLKRELMYILKERVAYFSNKYKIRYNKIKINKAQKRWASCSSKGNLNFSIRLICAPREIIDYVIIHELVHIPVPNHSKKFWKTVEIYMPDYKKRKNWLCDNNYIVDANFEKLKV